MRCIAMCYGNVPESRFVTGRKGRLTYITASGENSPHCSGVGFPNDAVFRYDDRIFTALRSAFERGDSQVLEKLKGELEPLT
jgi:hypothetical protein